jgi:hypothetical protein
VAFPGRQEVVMIKRGFLLLVPALCLILMTAPALAGGKITLRLYGGLSYLDAGDVNPGTQAFFDWGKTYFAPPPGGSIEGDYSAIHWGYEFGGDLIFELIPKVGIGIGVGYLQMSRETPPTPYTKPYVMMSIDDPLTGDSTEFTVGTKISTIPIRASLFLSLPIGKKLDITANTGVSYYLQAEYHADWLVGVLNSIWTGPDSRLSTTAEKKTAGFGLQGGVGIEYKFTRTTGLFVEAQGRYAKFRGFEGTSTSVPNEFNGGVLPSFSETGKLYYESVPTIPGSPRWILVQSAPPAGPGGTPREAAVDFSGVSFLAGIKIHF